MLGQIVAFFAVATSVAFASTWGCGYSGYGGYCGSSLLGAGLYNNGFYGSRIFSTGCANPAFTAAVGAPEVISSCGNSLVAPVAPVLSTGIMSSGLYGTGCYGSSYGLGYGCGSAFGGRGTGVIATAC